MAMTSSNDFQIIIEDYSDEVQELMVACRKLIYDTLPEVVECPWLVQKIIGYGTGPKKMTEHFSWLKPNKKHVTFGFNYGAELPDPSSILEGTGKQFRHVKIRKLEDLNNKALKDMLVFAITYKVPPINTFK